VAKSASRKTARKRAGAKKTGGARKAAAGRGGRATAARKTAGRAGGARKTGGRRGGAANPAFMAPVTPSEELAEVVGSRPIPRTEVTKRLWAYIKKNGLQDRTNKRMIKSDEALRPVFGGKAQVNMFEMTKLVSKHLS
jgi:upstream activation factor subunit UAF30